MFISVRFQALSVCMWPCGVLLMYMMVDFSVSDIRSHLAFVPDVFFCLFLCCFSFVFRYVEMSM